MIGTVATIRGRVSSLFGSEEAIAAETSSKHVVTVRSSSETIDVRSHSTVTWHETEDVYKVEAKIPPTYQQNCNTPRVRSALNIENRPDGTYLVQETNSAESAHALAVLIENILS